MKKIFPTLTLLIPLILCSCGYSTHSSLPSRFRTIHVEAFANKIDFADERSRNPYLPLLEVKARDAVVSRFQFDGALRIAKPETADLILKGELINYDRTALRYTDSRDVQEYRVQIQVNLTMWDTANNQVMWEEKGFTGEADYFVTGPGATSESEAVVLATTDLARRIVERAIEDW